MDWSAILGGFDLRVGEPMARHTTMKVGGPADCLLTARSEREIRRALAAAAERGIPTTLIGRGSNLLVLDGGIRGLVVKVAGGMADVRAEGTTLVAQAGAPLGKAALAALEAGLSGLEFAAGIPGGVGGAVAMNAGAYGGEMAQVVHSVSGLTAGGDEVALTREQLAFGYRESVARGGGIIITQARLALAVGDRGEIRARMDDLAARRLEKQPLDMPSAGSTFKRPDGLFAAKLIDDAGLKGARIGGAMVSPKHAGFVVNAGGATAADILALIERIEGTVLERFGVKLEREVCVLGEDIQR